MYIILAPLQVKGEYKDQFVKAMLDDAKSSVNNEPGCLRFDVIQDAKEANRIWVYEVYEDEEAFQSHLNSPHFFKWRETTKDWLEQGPEGAAWGSRNIWPTDQEWR